MIVYIHSHGQRDSRPDESDSFWEPDRLDSHNNH